MQTEWQMVYILIRLILLHCLPRPVRQCVPWSDWSCYTVCPYLSDSVYLDQTDPATLCAPTCPTVVPWSDWSCYTVCLDLSNSVYLEQTDPATLCAQTCPTVCTLIRPIQLHCLPRPVRQCVPWSDRSSYTVCPDLSDSVYLDQTDPATLFAQTCPTVYLDQTDPAILFAQTCTTVCTMIRLIQLHCLPRPVRQCVPWSDWSSYSVPWSDWSCYTVCPDLSDSVYLDQTNPAILFAHTCPTECTLIRLILLHCLPRPVRQCVLWSDWSSYTVCPDLSDSVYLDQTNPAILFAQTCPFFHNVFP